MSIESPKISEETLVAAKWYRKNFLLIFPFFFSILNIAIYWTLFSIEQKKAIEYFYSLSYLYWAVVSLILSITFGIYDWNRFLHYSNIYTKLHARIALISAPSMLLLFPVTLFFGLKVPSYWIHIVYISVFLLFVFNFFRYQKIWRLIMQDAQGVKYAKQMKSHGWTHNFTDKFIFKNQDTKNTLDTKLVNKLAWFFIRYGWLGGLLIFLGSTGMGGELILWIPPAIGILVAPELGRLVAKHHEMYLYISRIEKENNITIYNDIWND